jgi:transcriptional regulator with XRE-family HTH domain
MAKPVKRAFSRYSRNALLLLGQLIRQARLERKMTTAALAERAGISRGLVQRIEKGDPGCAIGAVFEAAAIVGVPLFNTEHQSTLSDALATSAKTLTLLPKAARSPKIKAQDAF